MKHLIMSVVLLTGLTTYAQQSEDSCPKDWPVSLITQNTNPGDLSLQFSGKSYPQLKKTADIDLEFSGVQYYNYMKITPSTNGQRQILEAQFIEKISDKKSGTRELTVQLAEIDQTVNLTHKSCYKLKLNPTIQIKEVYAKHKGDCFPLADFLCPSIRTATIHLETKNQGVNYRYKASSSIVINKK
jgi:hypothetical protein